MPATEILKELGETTFDLAKAPAELPTVSFLSPEREGPSSTERQSFTVAASNAVKNVVEIQLFHDGKALHPDGPGKKESNGQLIVPFTATLLPGTNTFSAKAISKNGVESQPVQLSLEFKGTRAASRLHILGIGINKYKNPRYNLNYCRPDIDALLIALEGGAQNIFESVHVHRLYDANATRTAIEEQLAQIQTAAGPQDMFVFAYAGHGVMSGTVGKTSSEFHLVPHDVTQLYGNNALLAEKGLPATKVREWVTKIPAKKQVLILDACQSGGMVDAFAMRGAAEEKAIAHLARSTGMVVIASTRTDQFASEMDTLGHGLFTYALLEALKGKADPNQDKKITVKEIEAYLNERVPKLSEKHIGVAQYPNSFSRGQDFPLAVMP